MTIRTTLEDRGPITPEELALLKKAAEAPIVFDEDCPELTAQELKKFRRVNEKLEQNRRTVTLDSEIPQKVS